MNDTLSVLASHFIGVIVSSMFYGFTLAQTWRYFRTYPKDRWSMKALVAFLWTLDTAQLALVAASIYHYTIVWQGDITMSSHVSKTFEASMGMTSIIAFLVQLTYAHRIWRLSFGNILVTFFIVLLALAALGSGGAMVVKLSEIPCGIALTLATCLLLVFTYLRWHVTSSSPLRKYTCFTSPGPG